MNPRERILALIVAVLVIVGIGYMGVNRLLISPASKLDRQAEELQGKIERMKERKSTYQVQARRFGDLAAKALGGDENRTSELVQARLFTLLELCGISGESVSLTPQSPKKVTETEKEVSWVVSADGTLEQLIDLFYLLNAEPYLQRVENLSIREIRRKGPLRMRLRYITLVLGPMKGEEVTDGASLVEVPPRDLDSEDREIYDVIAQRDLFRPFIERMVAAKPDEPSKSSKPHKSPDLDCRVVSLTTWGGQQEVHVRENATGEVEIYKPGESLGNTKIIFIDYRIMPMPNKPDILSGSRVIIEIDRTYWAVELGQNFNEKRKLSDDQIPPELAAEAKKLRSDQEDNESSQTDK